MSHVPYCSVERLLYTHGFVVFEDVDLTPAGQYALTRAFDPAADEYGHGKVGRPDPKSILHPDLRNIPGTPVQLIGNGVVTDEHILQGLQGPCKLKHPSHQSFHKTQVSDEDSAKGFVRPFLPRRHLSPTDPFLSLGRRPASTAGTSTLRCTSATRPR